eukprot:SAG31_NODE_14713_length_791_cov_1.065029_1_plen_96_part_01
MAARAASAPWKLSMQALLRRGLGLLLMLVAFVTRTGSAAASRGRAAEIDSTVTCNQHIAGAAACLPRPPLATEVAHRAWHVDGEASVTQALLSAGL